MTPELKSDGAKEITDNKFRADNVSSTDSSNKEKSDESKLKLNSGG